MATTQSIEYGDKNLFPFQVIDLTHTLSENTPSWNGSCGFKPEIKLDYSKEYQENFLNSLPQVTPSQEESPQEESPQDKVQFRVQQIKMHAGIGTHMDAPAHCIPNGKTIAEIELENLVCPSIVIDLSYKLTENLQVSKSDILNFEKKHGLIPEDSFVIIRTGWDKFWHNQDLYRNNMQFPSIAAETADYLLTKKIKGLGIDTLSPDLPSSNYPVHAILLGANKYIVENVANAVLFPPRGGFLMVLPIKGLGLTEAPVRLIGLIAKK